MTIVTKPLTAVKEEKPSEDLAPLVQVVSAEAADTADNAAALQHTYLNLAGRVRRLSRATHMCLVLTLSLSTMLGLVAGLHLYRTVIVKRNYCGSYRIPLSHGLKTENTLVAANFQSPRREPSSHLLDMFALFNHLEGEEELLEISSNQPTFQFNWELEPRHDSFESFELPEIFLGRYMHDFKVNYTAVIDFLGDKCFLMSLDRTLIPTPRSVYDILQKMKQGKFDIEYEEIRKTHKISGPPLTAFDDRHGSFIPEACQDKPTYMLEEVVEELSRKKRSTKLKTSGDKFGEFVGSRLIKYNIIAM